MHCERRLLNFVLSPIETFRPEHGPIGVHHALAPDNHRVETVTWLKSSVHGVEKVIIIF